MKKLLIILFLLIPVLIFGNTYYVATTTSTPAGNDGNAGTIAAPWATWSKANSSVSAGDTVYFRGGTWYPTVFIDITKDGTYSDPIVFMAYPGEKPIIDGSALLAVPWYGIRLNNANYFILDGITVQNVSQTSGTQACGIFNTLGIRNIIRNCIVRNVEGHGFQCYYADSTHYYNCDSYNNVDSLHATPGQTSDGFNSWTSSDTTMHLGYYTYYYGCRAWGNGDDGWDSNNKGLVVIDRCWAWDNGQLGGNGNGIKLTTFGLDYHFTTTARKVTNCISAYNKTTGFHENCDSAIYNFEIYNNIAYHNGWTGFYIPTLGLKFTDNHNVYKNNIAYANTTYQFRDLWSKATDEYNSWNTPPGVTVSDADFISVDSAGLGGARNAWGGLPVLTFLHIDAGSDLIGAGIGVGLVYDGDSLYHNDPPDLGAFAYDAVDPAPPELPQISTTSVTYNAFKATVVSNITSNGGGTISARGVCWDTDINPTTSDRAVYFSGTSGSHTDYIRGLKGGVTYHIRPFVTNETGTSYGADIEITTPAYTLIGNYIHNGNIVVYK